MQETAVRISDVAFAGYPVKDVQRAREFYESLLHLTPSMVSDDDDWVEYDVNGTAFFIGNFDGWKPSSEGPAVAFEVQDLEGTIDTLRHEDVPIFKEPFETPGCWMSVVGDPDGNSIIIHKMKPDRAELN